ncbi:MAG: [protein-PII] uridylyltransferase [Verrucomicrobiales bacterium]
MSHHLEKIHAHARKALAPAHKPDATQADIIRYYRSFLRTEEMRIRLLHRAGGSAGGGLRVGQLRAALLDVVLKRLFDYALRAADVPKNRYPLTLVATGGYGRGILNPSSDIDLLFLVPDRSARSIPRQTDEVIQTLFYLLTDIRIKTTPATRSISDSLGLAAADNETKTSLIEARFLAGDEELFKKLIEGVRKKCLKGKEAAYLQSRREDVRLRHEKFSNTVYLQEPHVKNGCGALRDYHNILWVAFVKSGARSLHDLVKQKLLSPMAYREMEKAYDFLHRVRNELHYLERRSQDVLTLRLQGRVATNLKYPGRRLLARIETFMRDYYHHTRNLFQHAASLMERFELEQEENEAGPLSFLARRQPKVDRFDGFVSRGGLIYAEHERVFKEDPGRMMRLYQHTQVRHLRLSPQMRQLVKSNYNAISKAFRYRKTNRETFEAILSRKGDVARPLRQMHRVGFLGRYLPEFGALTDLVQHEFFHRYSADEHTLRVAEQLDALIDLKPQSPGEQTLHQLFHDLEDPFVLYLAILLHDSGRATDAEHHEYESAILAGRVCGRLKLRLDRRRLLLFLVDHHLTFWRTATTKNIEDPAVIREFAATVRYKSWLDALYLLTYADSKGTNEQAWTGFKESLLMQLYHSTAAFFHDETAFAAKLHLSDNAEFRSQVEAKLGEDWEPEIEAHFKGMPERYFLFRSAHRVSSHLRLFRQFFRNEREAGGSERPIPTFRWRAIPERACSELTLVSRDRHMLLARVAGCLSACKLNILSADFFLRLDGVVFDIFNVCTTNLEPVSNERLLAKFERLLAEVFLADEPDFDALCPAGWGDEDDPEFAQARAEFPTRVFIANEPSPLYTVAEIDAVDRLGLLCDIFRIIGKHGFEVAHARINTEKGAALDTLYLTDHEGRKIVDRDALAALRQDLGRSAAKR